jgi:macrolide transport system ATP-binding/permease protein
MHQIGMNGIGEDLRLGFRALNHHRSFALVAALSLALGIGANTTIFSLLDAILLHPLPVQRPAELVALHTLDARNPGIWDCSYPNYKDYKERNQVFSSLLLATPIGVNLTGHGDPQRLIGQLVSADYFTGLGVNPLLGRGFLEEENRAPGANPVAVISYRLWQQAYNGDPQVLLKTIGLNRHEFRIVGVAPAGFLGVNSLWAADVWVPFMMYEQVYALPKWVNQRRALLFPVVGRLKPGVTMAHAQAAMESLSRDLEREFPKENRTRRISLAPMAEASIDAKTRPAISRAGTILLIISGLVLLIACANVANLLLVRAAGRSKEIAVRLAMGASRWRLIRQLLAESLILALVGGALGLLLGRGVEQFLWSVRPPQFKYAAVHLNLDASVLTYTLLISLATGVLFGLMPAFRATRRDLSVDLKERSGRGATYYPGQWNPRSLLVMFQVAFSLVALVGAGLFLRSLLGAGQVNPGFDSARLGTVLFNAGDGGYDEGHGREFQRQALERAATVPGVAAVALAKDPPLVVSTSRTMTLEGEEASRARLVLANATSPGFFKTVGIPLLRGRAFTPFDTEGTPRVAVVNEAAATQFWQGDAVGKVMHFFGDTHPVEVVGVVRNANYRKIGEAPQPMIYFSIDQYYSPIAVLYIHTQGDPEAVSAAVRREVQKLDRNLLLQSESLRTTVQESLWAQRISADLLGVFGILALLLAAVGLYGVIAYSVKQRMREMGIRMALGATGAHVQLMVLGEGIRLVALGVIIGLGIALAAARTIKSMLFMVSPRDALTFVLVPAALALVAVVACWVPAVRATRIDPAKALRDE